MYSACLPQGLLYLVLYVVLSTLLVPSSPLEAPDTPAPGRSLLLPPSPPQAMAGFIYPYGIAVTLAAVPRPIPPPAVHPVG